jgi:DNA-binding MarR family transcriptional regulator
MIERPLSALLLQTASLYRQAIARRIKSEPWLVDAGFRPACVGALLTVGSLQPLSQRELSSQLGIDPSDLVAVIDILERAGFVARRRDPADRRRQVLSLTSAGDGAVGRLRILLKDVDDEVLEPLPSRDRDHLRGLLDGVVAHHLA